jgi:hypothetical protein
MKRVLPPKQLKLKTETVRKLSEAELQRVDGGYTLVGSAGCNTPPSGSGFYQCETM